MTSLFNSSLTMVEPVTHPPGLLFRFANRSGFRNIDWRLKRKKHAFIRLSIFRSRILVEDFKLDKN